MFDRLLDSDSIPIAVVCAGVNFQPLPKSKCPLRLHAGVGSDRHLNAVCFVNNMPQVIIICPAFCSPEAAWWCHVVAYFIARTPLLL